MIWTFKEDKTWAFETGDEIAPGLQAIRLLADGTEAEIYLGRWLNEDVVVKVLRPHLARESHPVEGLRREAAVLRELEHAGVVALLDAQPDAERPRLILELIADPTLGQHVGGSGALQASNARRWCRDATAALAHVHERGFVHLDLNPTNVTVGRTPRLLDFGLARRSEAAAQMKSPAGTDPYMAPEQTAPARAGVGPAADVWSLGATLFFALTGERPFPRPPGGPTGPAGRWPQLVQPLRMPDDIDPALGDVICACLDRDPAARPTAHEVHAMVSP